MTFAVGAWIVASMLGLPSAGAAPRVAVLKEVRRVVLPDAIRITIELDAEVSFYDERLAGPPRIFVDLFSTRAAPPLVDQTLRFDGDNDLVRQVRIGRHPNNTTRVVLEAAGVSNYSVYPLYSPFRLVIDCVRRPGSAPAAPGNGSQPTTPPPPRLPRQSAPPLLVGRRLPPEWGRDLPSVAPQAAAMLRDALEPPVVTAPAEAVPIAAGPAPSADARMAAAPGVKPEATVPPPRSLPPASTNLPGGFSIARQLGLGVSRIVIDPGHGGYDPGARGKGVDEAELVLDVALQLEKLLQKIPGIEVILTRRIGEFIPLQERTAIANREGADLFLSIHANASPSPQARGVETYFLNFANNLSAASVAARENATSGQAMGSLPDLVKAIAFNNKMDESRDFATMVQRAMIERLRRTNKTVKDLGVKQAPFVVLIGAAMPSVLAEISFVTNPQEAGLLRSNAYRQRIAEGLFNAIRKYQTSLKRVTAVAHQN
jgi:N-acetylmuramoyl-L-alanine amidase